jgi:hypothetical protein
MIYRYRELINPVTLLLNPVAILLNPVITPGYAPVLGVMCKLPWNPK